MIVNKPHIIKSLVWALAISFSVPSYGIDVSDLEPEERFRLVLPYLKKQLNSDIALLQKAADQFFEDTGEHPSDMQSLLQNEKYLDGVSWTALGQFGFDYGIAFDRSGDLVVKPSIPTADKLISTLGQIDASVLNELLKGKTDTGIQFQPEIDFKKDSIDDKVADLLIVTDADASTRSQFASWVNSSNEANLSTNLLEFYLAADTVSFEEAIVASGLYDADNLKYRLSQNQAVLNDVKVQTIIDKDNENYLLDLSEEVSLADLTISEAVTKEITVSSVNADIVNGSPGINLGQLPAFAVTQISPSANIVVGLSGESVDSGVGSVDISVAVSPSFNTVTLTDALTLGQNLDVVGDAKIQGDLTVKGSTAFKKNLKVFGEFNATDGEMTLNELVVRATSYAYAPISVAEGIFFFRDDEISSDIYIKEINDSLIIHADEQVNLFSDKNITFNFDTTDDITLALNASKNTIKTTTGIDITKSLDVSGDFSSLGSQTFGSSANKILTLAGTLQSEGGSIALKFSGGVSSGNYTLLTGDPTSDITLTFLDDNRYHSYEWLGVDESDDLYLSGSLSLAGKIDQSTDSVTNTFAGKLLINNVLDISTDNIKVSGASLSLQRPSIGSLISFNDGTSSFGLYGTDANPNGTISALSGSLVIDASNDHLYINNGVGWGRLVGLEETAIVSGNAFGSTMQIGASDNHALQLIVNSNPALSIDVSGDAVVSEALSVAKSLDVTGDSAFKANVTIGDARTDAVTINGTLQNDLVLQSTTGSSITLARSAPTADITLDLPSITSTLIAMDVTGDVALLGNLMVANRLTQSNTSSNNTFNGQMTINNDLNISAVNQTVATFARNSAGQLISLSVDGGTNNFGIYGLNADPITGDISADQGSLAIDTNSGEIYLNIDGDKDWTKVIHTGDDIGSIIVGGNRLGAPISIGAFNAQGLSFITNNVERLSINSTGHTSLNGIVDVSGDFTGANDISVATDLIVNQMANINGNVTIGNATTDGVTVNGTLQNDLVLQSTTGRTITLARSAPTSDIALGLPSMTGTLVAIGVTGDLTIPSSLTMENELVQSSISDSNLFNSTVIINNDLTVGGGTGAAATISRSNVGELLSFGIGGTSNFGLYGFNGAPSAPANPGSLSVDVSNGALYIHDTSAASWVQLALSNRSILPDGNVFSGSISIGASDDQGLSLIANSVERLRVSNGGSIFMNGVVDVSGDVTIAEGIAVATDLTVNQMVNMNGDVTIGDARTDAVTINGTLQNDLVLQSTTGSSITLARSAPTADITLDLPSITSTLIAMDVTGDVALLGNLMVANRLTQSNTSSNNTFNGQMTINNDLNISAVNQTVATFARNSAGQLISLSVDGGTNNFGIYGLNADPIAGDISADQGSLAIDTNSGEIYLNIDGDKDWTKVIHAGDIGSIIVGGNRLGAPISIGAFNAQGLSFITNNVERLSINSTGHTSLNGIVDVSGDFTGTNDISVATDLIVNQTANINGNVTIGNATTDGVTVNGTLQNDLALQSTTGRTITLARSAPTSDITLGLPSMTGTLVAIDVTGDLTIPSSLTMENELLQSSISDSNLFNSTVIINNDLTVGGGTGAAATISRSNVGELLSFGIGGTSNFGLYGFNGAPSVPANPGSLSVDVSNGALYIRDGSDWGELLTTGVSSSTVSQNGNAVSSTMQLGATDDNGLSLITNGIDRLTISSTGNVNVVEALSVAGTTTFANSLTTSTNLIAGRDVSFDGHVVIGQNASSNIEVNGVIQNNLSLQSSPGSNSITLGPSPSTTSDIVLSLPDAAGTLLSDTSGNLSLSSNISIDGAFNLPNTNAFELAGTLILGNGLSINNDTAAEFIRDNGGQLLSFGLDGGSDGFGLYSFNVSPTVSANEGSLAIDVNSGALFINKEDGVNWQALLTSGSTSAVSQNGNSVTSTMKIGTTNAHGLSLITGGVSNDRLTISSTGAVGITGDLTVGGTSTLTGTTTINNDLTVAQNTSLNGNVVLGEDASSDITVNGVIQGGVSLRATNNNIVTLSPGVPSGNINVFLPATSGTLLVADGSGNLALTGRLSGTGVSISSGSNTSASFARDSDGQLLSFNIPANNFGLYGYSGAPSGGGNTGSLAIDTAAGDLYLRSGGNWSQVLTQGGNALSGTGGILSIGTSNSNSVALIANNNTALSIDAAGDITVSGKLKNNLVFDTAGTGDITLASSTVGSNITVTLPSAAGILLTDQDAISNIQDNTITNADLASGAFTKITSVGELTSLTVAGAVTAKSTLNVQGLLTAENGAAVSGDLSVTGGVTVGSLPTGSSSTNTLCASIAGELITCSSLGALKDDVQSLSLGMDTLLQLQPKQFTWKGDGKQDLGFIAEEVEAVNPLLAQYDGAGQLTGVKYRHLTALLTQAIQEQQTQLDNLGDVVVVNEGNMGVGKSAHDSFRLDVAGSIRGASFVESSDQRLKKNVESISDVLDGGVLSRLNQIDGVYYDWNNQYKQLNANVADVPQVGVLAQQVEQVLPRLVDTDSQGYKTVAYSKFVPYLVEGVKELSDQIEPLRQVVQSENGELSLQAKRLKLSDIVIESDSQDTLRIKRSTSLSSLLEISSTKVANEDAEGYVSTKDVYLADAKMWWSDIDNKIETVETAPMDWECQNYQQGSIRLVSEKQLLYICDSNKGWLRKTLSYVGG